MFSDGRWGEPSGSIPTTQILKPGVVEFNDHALNEQIASLFRRTMPRSASDDSIKRFADALIWNWLIVGTDAHAKNYSVLLSGDQVRLAPLYDLASALPYGTHENKLKFAMKLGDTYGVRPYGNPWIPTAAAIGVDAEMLVARAKELAVIAPDAFSDSANDPSTGELKSNMPHVLVDLVRECASRCVQAMNRPSA